mmetsp:Transcript_60665/g.120173  ORF Transcript_60665/g.120173 Transcript_60665/m.120173 type:complete len:83 (-) Transcript_60665:193-441(-)
MSGFIPSCDNQSPVLIYTFWLPCLNYSPVQHIQEHRQHATQREGVTAPSQNLKAWLIAFTLSHVAMLRLLRVCLQLALLTTQ